jgi:LysR family transcriptional activator of glutamate synthase operon
MRAAQSDLDQSAGLKRGSLLWDYIWNRFQDDSIRLTGVFQESIVLLESRGHPLAGRDEIRMEDLRRNRG